MSSWDDIVEQVAKDIHSGKIKHGQVSPEMIRATAEELFKGVKMGFESVEIPNNKNIDQYTFMQELRKNVYVFSGAKNYNELQEFSMLLNDGQGNVRPFSSFYKDIKTIDKTYKEHYLRAEYDMAVSSSTMSAKWQKFKAEADIFPSLRYRALHDGRTREEHLDLDGSIYPIGDDFWKMYFPPNDWGCRCDAEQVKGTIIVPAKKLTKIKPQFNNNVGQTGVLFSDKHPYFKDLPPSIKAQSILSMPEEWQWQKKEYANGGVLRIHDLVNKKAIDYPMISKIARKRAKAGHKVDILPEIHKNEKEARALIYPDLVSNKNPDLRIDGIYWDLKTPESWSFKARIRNIKKAAKQADKIFFELPSDALFEGNDSVENFAKYIFNLILKKAGWKSKKEFQEAIKNIEEIVFVTKEGMEMTYNINLYK